MSMSYKALSAVALGICTFAFIPAALADKPPEKAADAVTANEAKRAANKRTVLAFYDALVDLNFDEARKYVGNYYIEHDPEREDGLPGLRKALDYERRHGRFKDLAHKLIVADGDYVVLYSESHSSPPPVGGAASTASSVTGVQSSSSPGNAAAAPRQPSLVGDIYRLDESGKIVEHWNAIYTP